MTGRRHWVFTEPCGCAFGVQDATGGGSDAERAEAWASFYEGRAADGFAAMQRGVRLVFAQHALYLAEFEPQMRSEYRCPHGGGS